MRSAVGSEELVDRLVGPGCPGGEYDRDISVASAPDIFEQSPSRVFGKRRDGIPQPVESCAKRRAPSLIPTLVPAVAAAVGAPALDAVGTTPRSILDDFRLPRGRELSQELAIVGQARQISCLR